MRWVGELGGVSRVVGERVMGHLQGILKEEWRAAAADFDPHPAPQAPAAAGPPLGVKKVLEGVDKVLEKCSHCQKVFKRYLRGICSSVNGTSLIPP